ncbi:WD40 repeat domain-containing protein [Gemmata sp. JC717]|uniref:WD40 repeat domain-containing protein n=1 Tax=Gemmata algarum TaxID=2975278 RepID=UPI0021BA9C4A|nr:WD40 repeat domain-containing protein [Gemmata algarum]MDY3553999.1 WD40 repeat domain-containing protein [Gemmata algarum]
MFVWQAHRGRIRSLAFSPDGSLLATATGTGRLVPLWNPSTGELVRKLAPPTSGGVWSVAFAPDAPRVAAGVGSEVCVWDAVSGLPTVILAARERYTGPYYELAFGRGASAPLAGAGSRGSCLWSSEPGGVAPADRRLPNVTIRTDHTACLDFAPDGSRLATNELAKVELCDPATGTAARSFTHTHSRHHGPVKFSPDGARLAVGYRNTLSVYPADGDGPPVHCQGHTNAVWAACWSSDGRTLLTASADGTARLWDPTTGAELRSFAWGIGEIRAAAFSADGLLGAAAGADGKVVVWDVDA